MKLLTESGAPVLLVRASKNENSAIATFDYRDLTQYLLFATGQLQPDDEHLVIFEKLAKKAQQGHKIPLRDAKSLGNKEPFVTLPHTADLTAAVETFGGGVHRIVILKEGTNHAFGILSQLRLVKFLWENGSAFPIIDQLYPREVMDLGIGSQGLISIKYDTPAETFSTATDTVVFSGDKPLKEALILMNNEGVTSLAVVDNNYNVVGNISNVDVKVSNITLKCILMLYTDTVPAPYKIKLSTAAGKYLHTLHLRHPLYPWHDGRPRFLPCLLRKSPVYPCSHSRKACCYNGPQVLAFLLSHLFELTY